MMKHGIIVGIILVLGLFNEAIGLPVLFIYLILTGKKLTLERNNELICLLILLKICWITIIFVAFKDGSIYSFFQTIGMDLMILMAFLLRGDERFYKGFFIPIAMLFMVDFFFNSWTFLYDADPLGRIATMRPDDIMPRVGGIFFHPYYSINISFVTILFSLYLRHRLLLLLAVINMVWNTSYRSNLTLIILVAIIVLLRLRVKFEKLVAIAVAMVVAVFVVTYISVPYLSDYSGNYYRVFAWKNAIEFIRTDPIVGTHHLSVGNLPAISEDTIRDFGISESTYLSYALHYGIIPAILQLLLIMIIFKRRVRLLYLSRESGSYRFNFFAAIFAGVIFVDTFYGNILGSMLTTICYGFICISTRDTDILDKSIQSMPVSIKKGSEPSPLNH